MKRGGAIDFGPYLAPLRGPRQGRRVSAGEALGAIADGSRVSIAGGCATPQALLAALGEQRDRFRELELVSGHMRVPFPLSAEGEREPFRITTLQASAALGDLEERGALEVLPCRYSDFAHLFCPGGIYPVDVALVQVSPPGPGGLLSLGVSVGSTVDVVRSAPLVIAQVNPLMPYTFGAGELPAAAFDFLVEHEEPLIEMPVPPPGATARRIAEHAAGEVADGATLQFGIGAVPEAILQALGGRRDLGLHGGMVSDACIDLVEGGALTGSRKSFDRGLLVAAEVIGTRRLFDWVDRNPRLQMAPAGYSHGVAVLARCGSFVALNSALEVALDGTVNAESVGSRLVSGPGGQPDFAVGASLATGGRSLVALPATAARGTRSRIVRCVDGAAVVTLPRYLTDRVVTEWGVARLRGATLRERGAALAAIAHPDFRDALLAAGDAGGGNA